MHLGGKSFKVLSMSTLLVFLAPWPALSAIPSAGAVWIEVESGAVFVAQNDVRIPGDSGTFLSLSNELSIAPAPYFRWRLSLKPTEDQTLSFLYSPLTLNARGTLGRDVDFAGGFFPAGTPLLGIYRFDSYRVTYRFDLAREEAFQFGLGLTVKMRNAEIALNGADEGSKTDLGFVPLLNLRLDWRPWSGPEGFLLEADAAAAPQGRAEDVLVAFTRELGQGSEIRLGYRMLEGGADNDSVYTFAWLHYLAAGLSLAF